jgi:hypothetical protein
VLAPPSAVLADDWLALRPQVASDVVRAVLDEREDGR